MGVNPKGHPAPLMSYDELKGVILPGFEKAKPYGHKQTSGGLNVEAAFIRGINDERIELVRFLKG